MKMMSNECQQSVSALLAVMLLNESSVSGVPDSHQIETWVAAAYQGDKPATLSVKIVDQAESQLLNSQYRNKNKPTNVLSFPMGFVDEAGVMQLGDLALCAPVILAESQAQNKASDAHWAHMFIHGMLHLQGYDHIDEQDAQRMEAVEKRIMAHFNYSDPYA